jgi:hypothetical protein
MVLYHRRSAVKGRRIFGIYFNLSYGDRRYDFNWRKLKYKRNMGSNTRTGKHLFNDGYRAIAVVENMRRVIMQEREYRDPH